MKLRLGPVPDSSVTRITLSVPGPLKILLDRYAELHSQSFGQQVDAATLIPRILDQFLKKDRAFQRALKSNVKQSSQNP